MLCTISYQVPQLCLHVMAALRKMIDQELGHILNNIVTCKCERYPNSKEHHKIR
jgi:hypothetical protein